ncbi:hypothetical protein DFH09DRAFT_944627 [Mycena vulgaris]|nr:hypothetical protein DFH09DRAFT_944627 [Mycena vulgaris]
MLNGKLIYLCLAGKRLYTTSIHGKIKISFSPLQSEGSKELDAEGPVCSAKSMYRLADKLGLEELKSCALEYLCSRLSEDNILHEVFSSFTSMYGPVVRIGVLSVDGRHPAGIPLCGRCRSSTSRRISPRRHLKDWKK